MADQQSGRIVDFSKRSQYVSEDKQLLQYFKKSASGIIFPMLVGFLSISFCRRTMNATIVFSVFAFLSLLLNTILLLYAGKMREKEDREQEEANATTNGDEESVKSSDKRPTKWLCIAASVSNFFLMITAICLMTVLNVAYLYLAFVLICPIGILYGCCIVHSAINKVEWGVVQYEDYQEDLKHYFDLSSEITQAAFLGLPATLFSQLRSTNCKQSSHVRLPEVLTMYTVLFGLFIMLMCSVPLASGVKATRERFVSVFIRYSTYGLVLSLAVVAVLAMAAIGIIPAPLEAVAFVLVLACLIGAISRKVYCRTQPSTKDRKRRVDMVSERSHSMVWFGFCPAMFGVLMASYSRSRSKSIVNSGDADGITGLYKTCIFFMVAALISNLTRMVLVDEEDHDEGEPPPPPPRHCRSSPGW
uniref:Uncharacterized protein n=1 Tax=Oryza brachyantha TaxID=4533 RepID=J3KZL1_ORYBR